jgi:hypothetical protein
MNFVKQYTLGDGIRGVEDRLYSNIQYQICFGWRWRGLLVCRRCVCGLYLRPEPLIVDEFNGFEGVGCRDMLGDIVSVVVSVPLDGSFYVSWEDRLGFGR